MSAYLAEKKIKPMPEWDYDSRLFYAFESLVGFVYKITRLSDGKFYIGKKLFKFKKKIKRKGKRTRIEYVDSDWETYWGSSRELQEDIKKLGYHAFKREITHVCMSKHRLALTELKEQLAHNVMEPDTNCYNGIINVRLRRLK